MKHLKSSAYSPVSTNLMGQSLIYDHMSSHYRRLYNAKSRVDCSPPRHMRKTGCHISPQDMALVEELVYDSKLGPDAFCSQCYSTPSGPPPSFASISQSPTSWKKPAAARSTRTVSMELKPADAAKRHTKCFESPAEKPFKPQILKSNAQSKLRDLRVYHPPRRKPKKRQKVVEKEDVQKTQQTETPTKEEEQVDDGFSSASSAGPWLQMSLYMEYPCPGTTQKSTSEESSRDSAYNGGVSSGGESRGPTPEQSPEKPPVPPVCLTPALEARLKRQKEEALYVQFIHDITQDVLHSCIFSNKGLRQVFQRHISLNKDKLNMDRMKAEVSKLQIQLDMPDDEEDKFPMPSQEDIVLSWPSTTQYTEDIPSRQSYFMPQPTPRTSDRRVSSTLTSPLSSKTGEILVTTSESVTRRQTIVDEFRPSTAAQISRPSVTPTVGSQTADESRKVSTSMAPSSPWHSKTDEIIRPSLESKAGRKTTVDESRTGSLAPDSKSYQTMSLEEFVVAEEYGPVGKSKEEEIQSLVDMGFTYSLAEEICQSVHYRDSTASTKLSNGKTASEPRISSRKSSAQTRPISPTLSSIEEITELSDPPSACYCSYTPPASDAVGGMDVAHSPRKAEEIYQSNQYRESQPSHPDTKLSNGKTTSEPRISSRKSSAQTRLVSPTLSSIEEITELSDPPSACYCSYSPPASESFDTESRGMVKNTCTSDVVVHSPCKSSKTARKIDESREVLASIQNLKTSEEIDSYSRVEYRSEVVSGKQSKSTGNSKDKVSEDLSDSRRSSVFEEGEDRSSYVEEDFSSVAEEFRSEAEDESITEEIIEEYRSSRSSSVSPSFRNKSTS